MSKTTPEVGDVWAIVHRASSHRTIFKHYLLVEQSKVSPGWFSALCLETGREDAIINVQEPEWHWVA